jgi:hypothetical protein
VASGQLRFPPESVIVPKQFPPDVLFATIVFLSVTVPVPL